MPPETLVNAIDCLLAPPHTRLGSVEAVDGTAAHSPLEARATNLSNLPTNAAALSAPTMSGNSDDTKYQRAGPRRTPLIVNLLCVVNKSRMSGYEGLRLDPTHLVILRNEMNERLQV